MSPIDLNADLGEGGGGDDALLEIVTSASIACGGHAGDRQTMLRALRACRERGIRAGAHPGFVDRANFGRKRLDLPIETLQRQLAGQLEDLRSAAAEAGVALSYVKLHGAMANRAAEDLAYAQALFGTVQAFDPDLSVLALDNSRQVDAAHALGLPVIREAYADRAYTPDGQLASRALEGAVIHDPGTVVQRCLRLALEGEIVATDGTILRSQARSICVHGDTPGAAQLARKVRAALEAAGVTVAAS